PQPALRRGRLPPVRGAHGGPQAGPLGGLPLLRGAGHDLGPDPPRELLPPPVDEAPRLPRPLGVPRQLEPVLRPAVLARARAAAPVLRDRRALRRARPGHRLPAPASAGAAFLGGAGPRIRRFGDGLLRLLPLPLPHR